MHKYSTASVSKTLTENLTHWKQVRKITASQKLTSKKNHAIFYSKKIQFAF